MLPSKRDDTFLPFFREDKKDPAHPWPRPGIEDKVLIIMLQGKIIRLLHKPDVTPGQACKSLAQT